MSTKVYLFRLYCNYCSIFYIGYRLFLVHPVFTFVKITKIPIICIKEPMLLTLSC